MIYEPLIRAIFSLMMAVLCAGCFPINIPVPVTDQPPTISAALPVEFATGDGETLVLVVRYRGEAGEGWTGSIDEPLFVKPAELQMLAKELERTGWGTLGSMNIATVRELCMIASTGRTVSLHLYSGQWMSSEIALVNDVWRNQFIRYLSTNSSWWRGKEIWRSAPCKQLDWSRGGVLINWTDEQSARVSTFLRELPTKQ